jgi:hypothetical protein
MMHVLAKKITNEDMLARMKSDKFSFCNLGFVYLPFYTGRILKNYQSAVTYHNVSFIDLEQDKQYPHIWNVYYYNPDKFKGIVVWEDNVSYVTFRDKKYMDMTQLHFALENFKTERMLSVLD